MLGTSQSLSKCSLTAPYLSCRAVTQHFLTHFDKSRESHQAKGLPWGQDWLCELLKNFWGQVALLGLSLRVLLKDCECAGCPTSAQLPCKVVLFPKR